ncbi:M20/M25/M40 family metallo-hydrolase [Flagellimonas aequoris]|uniref:M20/M25/M40 family metallo-hydrolase n=2 Tax=Flagellimonas aequoris TaxID=2306997 RepID=A0A418ND94_9FLAO|nr:M20/M25/M40 family metallo-hydrolase [Allomuricauda aequoris]RIV74473.1 M20/M25/M40 family metallo-hydrolase [Allomuricauda aequoris]TXK08561.1 M20/M25/M40 family metallo-hydrolase [Allomuricauda aequoris]
MKKTTIAFVLALGMATCILNAQETPTIEKQYTKEIEKLTKAKKVKAAFEIIKGQMDQTTADLITLTEVLAPPFMEDEKGKVFAKMLEEAGIDSIWTDKVGNVIGLRKGTSGESGYVGVDAHLDVVFPEGTDVTVQKVGDTLKAPGIGDDTRALAMLISMLKAMNKADIKTGKDVLIVGSVGEEGLGDLRGMKYMFNESGLDIDSWIAIDGGSMGRISNAGLGSKRYKLEIKGKGGHSWGAFGLANPHHALGKAIDVFSEAAWDYTSGDIPKTSFNVGRIGGGTSVNSIPFESWAEIDMRAIDPKNLDEIEAILKNSVEKAITAYNASGVKGEVTYELIKIGDRPSGELPGSLPLIQRTMAATQYFGVVPSLGRGSTNINIPVSKGIPSVCIGRGGKGGGAHSLHEWYLNDEPGDESIQLALLVTLAQTGLEK